MNDINFFKIIEDVLSKITSSLPNFSSTQKTYSGLLRTACLGMPRIGGNRELKKALEDFWAGKTKQDNLESVAKSIRIANYKTLTSNGINYIPSGDFSYYDQVLDMSFELGHIPERYRSSNLSGLELYFAMARGYQKDGKDLVAGEMTKWFDTNYHYIVPEFESTTASHLAYKPFKFVKLFKEAIAEGYKTRPVIIGPVSYLLLGKGIDNFDKFSCFEALSKSYHDLINDLVNAGAEGIQIDEPFLVMDIDAKTKAMYTKFYENLLLKFPHIKFHLVTYFESLKQNFDCVKDIPFASIHIDLTRGEDGLNVVISGINKNTSISLGLVDGRNIWINNISQSVATVKGVIKKIGMDRVIIASSCSLMHSPVGLDRETELKDNIKSWLAFAKEKTKEIAIIKDIISQGEALGEVAKTYLHNNEKAILARKSSKDVHNFNVHERLRNIGKNFERQSPFSLRYKLQNKKFNLKAFPTTTIGSFPQTADLRSLRKQFKAGLISESHYNETLKSHTEKCVKEQERIGLDVLVHGEFERNDMVEYFGEQLNGFVFTQNGWVQSYGSRCVKPPVIFGDVSREKPMTVEWSKFAQSITTRPMKGMLTGPVTILQWSFVRDDLSRETVCKQIALALQDEVLDLEKNGIGIIQMDEPAIREGLPLRRSKWNAYLQWSVDAFKISVYKASNETQIHTHMCYSEFNDIMPAIARMDADVISIETSRSKMELLDAFAKFKYPNAIGPGVYDIHSPRVPSAKEMISLVERALKTIPKENIWINPDCGLKTRGWSETISALEAMVKVANDMRS